jgi:hypothetical protein
MGAAVNPQPVSKRAALLGRRHPWLLPLGATDDSPPAKAGTEVASY